MPAASVSDQCTFLLDPEKAHARSIDVGVRQPRSASSTGLRRACRARRLGRLRAVLRLGERADARRARRAVLARLARQTLDGLRPGDGASSSWAAAPAASPFRWRATGVDDRRHRSIGARCSRAPRRAPPAAARADRAFSSCAATSGTCRFPIASFPLVIAPYGILQSLLRERDLAATLDGRARACSRRAARSASSWSPICRPGRSTRNRVSLRGRARQRRATSR